MYSRILTADELYHHGILGQRWGIRRYQNPDGSLTEAGKRRYQTQEYKLQQLEYKKKKLVAKLENEQLKKKLAALSDKNVDDLKNPAEQKSVKQGQSIIKDTVKTTSTAVGTNLGKEAASIVGKYVGNLLVETFTEKLAKRKKKSGMSDGQPLLGLPG